MKLDFSSNLHPSKKLPAKLKGMRQSVLGWSGGKREIMMFAITSVIVPGVMLGLLSAQPLMIRGSHWGKPRHRYSQLKAATEACHCSVCLAPSYLGFICHIYNKHERAIGSRFPICTLLSPCPLLEQHMLKYSSEFLQMSRKIKKKRHWYFTLSFCWLCEIIRETLAQ